jgi:hypothetical protein
LPLYNLKMFLLASPYYAPPEVGAFKVPSVHVVSAIIPCKHADAFQTHSYNKVCRNNNSGDVNQTTVAALEAQRHLCKALENNRGIWPSFQALHFIPYPQDSLKILRCRVSRDNHILD